MPYRSWLSSQSSGHGAPGQRGIRSQVDSLFEDWFGRNLGGTLAPRVDISETDHDVQLAVELPGVEEKDIDVSLAGDQITIKGEKKSEQEDRQSQSGRVMHRVERSYGAFQRTMTLPYRADPNQVSAQFRNGVLKITVPKPPEAVGRLQGQRIPINRME